MKTFKLFSMATLAIMMAACSSNDDEILQPAQQQGPMKFTATLTAPNGGTTRTTATAGTGSDAGKFLVTWAVDDKIALVYEDANGDRQKVEANVDAVDAGVATISATLPTAVKDGTSVTLVYPYAILDESDGADYDFMTNKEYTSKRDYFSTQTGAAPTDATNGLPKFDWRDGEGTFSVGGSGVTLSSNVTMNSNIAIWKLNLEDQSHVALAASELVINCGRRLSLLDISPAYNEVYLYMPLPYYNFLKVMYTGKPLEILAYNGYDYYSYTHSAVDLTAGKIYNSTVTLAKLWVGNVENSSGNGTSIKYCAGETWAQAIANHQNDEWAIEDSHVHHPFYGDLKNAAGSAYISPDSEVVPGNTYKWTNF